MRSPQLLPVSQLDNGRAISAVASAADLAKLRGSVAILTLTADEWSRKRKRFLGSATELSDTQPPLQIDTEDTEFPGEETME